MRPTPEQIECLKRHNRWRRGEGYREDSQHPAVIGEAIDALVSFAETFDPQSFAERVRDAIAEHVGEGANPGSHDAWFKGRCEMLKITVQPDGKVEVS